MAESKELHELQLARQKIDLELAELQLEDLRESSLRRRSQRAQRSQTREATERSLADGRVQKAVRESACPHRKGGKDIDGMFMGNAADHSVIKHTLPHGAIMVVCQRCMKEWHPPVRTEIDEETGKPYTLAAYTELLKDYRKALNLPTDNTPSGTRLFSVAAA